MGTYKLRVKIGLHEFEAEGPVSDVKAQFKAWKELIGSGSAGVPSTIDTNKKLSPYVTEVRTREGYAAPWDIFNLDDKRKMVTLRVHPTGENRDADAALLILYGYKQSLQQDEVPVTRLKESMEVSGLRPERIDRTLGVHIRSGLIMKAGRAKGGKYRLTNTGFTSADAMARSLFEQLAP
jgi:hypothetical protein